MIQRHFGIRRRSFICRSWTGVQRIETNGRDGVLVHDNGLLVRIASIPTNYLSSFNRFHQATLNVQITSRIASVLLPSFWFHLEGNVHSEFRGTAP